MAPLAFAPHRLGLATIDFDLEHEVTGLEARLIRWRVLDDARNRDRVRVLEHFLQRVVRIAKIDAGEGADGQRQAFFFVIGLGAQIERLFHVGERGRLLRQIRRDGARRHRGEQDKA